ncbi:MAG: hypothetical protein DRQ88_00615 [Epsilonproteobacteria bacterium]|nr:MAG: hypothetical protein DRQ89_03695 [Campylobacterota bacterium]RLA68138.1 MAG: hypothetical protein DRQ88_00615 [Campylobacterota bacterium]
MGDFKYIKYLMEGQTVVISMNRPEVYNALNFDAKKEIIKAIKMANKDTNVRSLILTGEGKAFCTGQDLNDRTIRSNGGGAVDLGHTLETEWNPLIKALKSSKKIIIGSINGVCAGAGLSIALALDLLVARPKVKYISGFSKLGLAPDAGSTFGLTKALGAKKTLEFFLFGEALLTEDLKAVGVINYVDEDPLKKAIELGQKINELAPMSVEMIKTNINFAMEGTYAKSMDRETYTQRFLGNTNDYQEGLTAFFEKREPKFKGI